MMASLDLEEEEAPSAGNRHGDRETFSWRFVPRKVPHERSPELVQAHAGNVQPVQEDLAATQLRRAEERGKQGRLA